MRARSLVLLLVLPGIALAGCLSDPADPEAPPGASDDTDEERTWTELPDVPTPRTEVASAVLETDEGPLLVVIGGFASNNQPSTAVEAYSFEQGTWSELPPLPVPIHHAPAIAYDGTVHLLGGYNAIPFQAVPTHLVWSPGDSAWTNASPLPNARGGHGAALVDGKVYLVGGVGADGSLLSVVDVYDLENGTWSSGPELPTPRDHLAVTVVDGRVHAVGGREQSLDTNTGAHEVLTPGTGWETTTEMPTPRGGIGAASVDGKAVVVGGESNEGTFEHVEAYDPGSDTWERWPDLPTPRHGLGVVEHDGQLIVAAGGPEPGLTVSGAVEVLGPPPQ